MTLVKGGKAKEPRRRARYDKVRHPRLVRVLLSKGAPKYRIFDKLGVTSPTFYAWVSKYAEFKEAVDEGQRIAAGKLDKAREAAHKESAAYRLRRYEPGMCKTIIDEMTLGASFQEVAAALGCSYSALNAWVKHHPEVREAIQIGQDLSEAWWMRKGRENIHNRHFNTALWYRNMINRFGWSDHHKLTADIEITLSNMTDEQIDARIREHLEESGQQAGATIIDAGESEASEAEEAEYSLP